MATKKKTAAKTPKKTVKKKAKAPVGPKLSVNGRDERYLLILIAGSERSIRGVDLSTDELFTQQTNRLKSELKQLRAKK